MSRLSEDELPINHKCLIELVKDLKIESIVVFETTVSIIYKSGANLEIEIN